MSTRVKVKKVDPELPQPEFVSQMDLFCMLIEYLQARGYETLLTRQLNAVSQAATIIASELSKPRVPSSPGMGLAAWLKSDDTGSSSLYMAHKLCGAPFVDYAYPSDPDDLGRCIRFLQAVNRDGLAATGPTMAATGREWAGIVAHWDELNGLYAEESPSGSCPKTFDRMREIIEAPATGEAS